MIKKRFAVNDGKVWLNVSMDWGVFELSNRQEARDTGYQDKVYERYES